MTYWTDPEVQRVGVLGRAGWWVTSRHGDATRSTVWMFLSL